MATAVIDLDLGCLPPTIRVPKRHTAALALIRLKGAPVGKTLLPVRDGRIDVPDLEGTLVDACGESFWDRWITDALELPRDGIPPEPLPSATVAVCTRDRPHDLRACLRALGRLPDDGQEVLVVDNAPATDAACEVVAEFPQVRYVRETRPGLNAARQRALREAHGDVVAFTDDDAQPDRGWLRALLSNFHDPLVLCATGLTMPLELETPAQEWFERTYPFSRGFTRRVFQSPPHNALVGGPIGAGVNMAVRRTIGETIGGFDEALDAGTPTKSGGDHDLFTRVLGAGFRIVYDPVALTWHRHRRTWPELYDAVYGYGVGVYAAWTRALFVDRELAVPVVAWRWLWHDQLRALARALLRRRGSPPLRLVLAELRGCVVGPFAYLLARRALRKRESHA
jgi:GT2 family glycosyltransferase